MNKRSDTIAAISTPIGKSGIGIIRISGPNTLPVINEIFNSKINLISLSTSQTRRLIHGFIIQDGEKIDEILLAYMPPNKSYTGEHTIELNCHGGRAILTTILECVISKGARLAEPGEFTRQAFKNGRMNLVQAEAINELINARTKKAIRVAWRQIEGGLTNRCIDLKEILFNTMVKIQTSVDFEIESNADKIVLDLNGALGILNKMLISAEKSKFMNQGCWVVITGPPNAGKSSVFNSIINIDRSIVCDTPGTTRDHITETIEIDGIEVRITDTAGIRETNDKIEKISIERSKQQVKASDIVIYIIDQSCILLDSDRKEARKVFESNGIVVLNKIDKEMHDSVNEFLSTIDKSKVVFVSALNSLGLNILLDKIAEMIEENSDMSENSIVTNIRQTRILENSKVNVLNAISETNRGNLDLVMYELKEAINNLSEIVGEISEEDVLDSIFSKFCIGK